MIRPLLKSHFLAVLCFFCSFASLAQDPVGQVLVSSGEVFAVNASSEKRVLVRGDYVFDQDLLVTDGGKAQIRFMDGALFTLYPNTEFKVTQYVFDPKQKTSWLELLKGSFRTATGLVAREAPESYKVRTPVATIGVRGTTIGVGHNTSSNVTEVSREKGGDQKVTVAPPSGKELVLDDEHTCARVEGGKASYCKEPTSARPDRLVSKKPTTPLCPVDF